MNDAPDRLQALREQGAERLDATRFHYLEVLSRRLPEAAPNVRPLLQARFEAALADYEARFAQATQAARTDAAQIFAAQPEAARELRQLFKAGDFKALRRLQAPAPSALAELNRHVRRVTQQDTGSHAETGGEMKSVRRFHELWSKLAAVDQVDKAVGRGPENAGPLNSHMLVLNSLALMRELSPSYLRRFLSHVDTLLWLEQQGQKPQKLVAAEAKPARRARQKK